MKKILLTALLALTISASCFAEGAAGRFAAEEKAADTLIAAITGSTVTYDAASRDFSQGLKTKLPADKFTALKDSVKKQVGTIKNPNFVLLNKPYNFEKGYNGADELVYIGSVAKDKFARIIVIFALENNAPKITAFQVTPVEAKKPEEPAKK
ncbi:MAG: hypothetical protein IKZ43_00525 [Acidaminococcaceae bacterium]|nr:hypothetical protein [Acidaminococcaceae bacterium]